LSGLGKKSIILSGNPPENPQGLIALALLKQITVPTIEVLKVIW